MNSKMNSVLAFAEKVEELSISPAAAKLALAAAGYGEEVVSMVDNIVTPAAASIDPRALTEWLNDKADTASTVASSAADIDNRADEDVHQYSSGRSTAFREVLDHLTILFADEESTT